MGDVGVGERTFDQIIAGPHPEVLCLCHMFVTSAMAARLGRSLQQADLVFHLSIPIYGLNEDESYEEFLVYLRTTKVLGCLSLYGHHSFPQTSNQHRRILEAVSCTSSITELHLISIKPSLSCLRNQPYLHTLYLVDCCFRDEIESASVISNNDSTTRLHQLVLSRWDSATLAFLFSSLLSNVHSRIEALFVDHKTRLLSSVEREGLFDFLSHLPKIRVFSYRGLASLVEFLRVITHVATIRAVYWQCTLDAAADRSVLPLLGNPLARDRHNGAVISAVKRSSSIVQLKVSVHVRGGGSNVEFSMFTSEEEAANDTTLSRNFYLPRIMGDVGSVPLGLLPYLFKSATQSGHGEHIKLLAEAIRELSRTRPLGKRHLSRGNPSGGAGQLNMVHGRKKARNDH